MNVLTDRVEFQGSQGQTLAARLDRPATPPVAYALFAHCFTCGKDVHAAQRIAAGLAERGVAVLRFDFTGLGHSEGEFANTDFTSNVEDLIAAAAFLRQRYAGPQLLIGHSLGGAAVIAAAGRIEDARAVATIGAPADPEHVAHLFADARETIETQGTAQVEIAGRRFRIGRRFLQDIAAQTLHDDLGELRKALLVFHAPRDGIVGIDNATRIFTAAKHPKSFVSLDDADHLLSRRADASFVAQVLAAWADRYILPAPETAAPEATEGRVVVQEAGGNRFRNLVLSGRHRLLADEPASVGGSDTGPSPYDYLLAGLGACTSMTLRLYADRKQLPLTRVRVSLAHRKVHAQDCADCEGTHGQIDEIDREIAVEGDLDASQRRRLLEIADKCPVHRTLEGEVKVRSRLAEGYGDSD
jgi:putative redox protein